MPGYFNTSTYWLGEWPDSWQTRRLDLVRAYDVYHSLSIAEHTDLPWANTDTRLNKTRETAILSRYLRQRLSERDAAYKKRIESTYFDNQVASRIDSYAALLSRFVLSADTHPTIKSIENDVDGQKTSLSVFLQKVAVNALRDSCCVVLVTRPSWRNQPVLSLFDIREVGVPDFSYLNGTGVLNQAALHRKSKKYDFEKKSYSYQDIWWLFKNGYAQKYLVNDDKEFQEEPVQLTDAAGNFSPEIPVIWFSLDPSSPDWQIGVPPFQSAIDLSIKLLNKTSELDEIESKCNCPTPREFCPPGKMPLPGEQSVDILGSGGKIVIPHGGNYDFLEPNGRAIEVTEARNKELQNRIAWHLNQFLEWKEQPKTATQSGIEFMEARANLATAVAKLESFSYELFNWIVKLSSRQYRKGEKYGQIIIDEEVLRGAANQQDVNATLSCFTEGIWDRKTTLAKLDEIGWTPKGFELESQQITMEDELITEDAEDGENVE